MKRILSLFLLSCSFVFLNAQELPKLIPNSPEAQAFAEYGSTPVNMYVGKPEIAIPIYTIKSGPIEMPISLTYDASGIKVNQLATSVGLGWNLNLGGMITRNVKGLPDQGNGADVKVYSEEVQDLFDFFIGGSNVLPIVQSDDIEANKVKSILSKYEISDVDLEADTFTFSAAGLSGTIVIDYKNSQAFCQEHPDIIVNYQFNSNIQSWEIIDTHGIKYTFSQKETTWSDFSILGNEYDNLYTSAWYLTELSHNNNSIQLNYSSGVEWQNEQEAFNNEVTIYNGDLDCHTGEVTFSTHNPPVNIGEYKIRQPTLSTVKVNGELALSVKQSSTDRADLAGRKKIDGIVIHSTLTGDRVKAFEFVHSYFTTPEGFDNELNKRLKLDEIRTYGQDNNTSSQWPITGAQYQSYFFHYINENQLPARDSASQDYWGYYNGSPHNGMVAGNTDRRYELMNLSVQGGISNNGANRKPNFDKLQNGTLNKITYPTGGSTQFYYRQLRNMYTGYEKIEPMTFSFTGGVIPVTSQEY
ncbi:MAG: hypothetical protein AAGH46_13040, partial [Bacteroidota bacterium]